MTSRVLLVFLFFIRLLPLGAQELSFRHLAVEDGLSQNTINCIYQDAYGFLWFGTQDGLNAYDGYDFTVFRYDPEDSATLSHNWIWDIIEDTANNLWIATWNGLTKYDRELRTFKRFLPDSTDHGSISGTRPASMVRDGHGRIWVAVWGGGLNLLDPVTETFISYRKAQHPDRNYPGDYVRKLFIDKEGILWVGTWNGLWKCPLPEKGDPVFERYNHQPGDASSLSSDRITSFAQDHQGNLWIGTLGGGLNLYHPEYNAFERFMHDPADVHSISNNDITCIDTSIPGSLWVGTVSSGLNLFDPESRNFRPYRSDPADPRSLASDNVYALFTDRGGIFWVGAGGLNIYNPGLLRFACPGPLEMLSEQLEGKSVYTLLEDSRGKLWAGSYHNGLACLDPGTSRITWYTNQPGNPNSLSSNSITSIAEAPDGTIWVSTAGDGLNRLDPNVGKWTRFREIAGQVETAGLDHISGIVTDDKGTLWIATSDHGIILYQPETDTYRSLRTDPGDPGSLSGDYLLRIFKDSHGDIWLGTWGAGLNRFEGEEKGFTRFMSDPSDPNSLPDNIIHSIYEQVLDTSRIIWVGTANGLAYMDPDEPAKGFRPSEANGELPSHSVYGTLFDSKNQQWISTNSGISVYNVNDQTLKHYTHRDGLPGNEFNAGAFLELDQGFFAFGGIEGLLVFHPDSVGESTFQPKVALTSFSVLNEQVYSGMDLNAMESITLSHRQNFFSFEFSSMDFSDPENNRFMYMLEGIDGDWIHSGDRNFAAYTKIDPGEYHFRVKGTNSDGRWSESEASMWLTITPPFWQRWWFRATLIALALMGFYAIHLYRIRRVREIERLRTRIASDLHDDIGSALTRISVHSQQIMSQEELGRIRQSTRKISELSREVVSTMSDIVWSIDARNDTLADFLSRMQDLTYSLLSDQDIQVTFSHKGLDVKKPLKVQHRQNLYYIFKEAVHNIAKHSGADRVEIDIENSHAGFRMKIADNGSGYDPGSVKGGNGIRNMQMRAGRMGAKLEITADQGVLIDLKMKSL